MATTSTVPAVLVWLRDNLSARAGLEGVGVFTGPLTLEAAPLESIQFARATDQLEWDQLGNLRRTERYDLRGLVYIEQPGADEDAIQAARERAYAILAEVEDLIVSDHRLGGLALKAQVGEIDLLQFIGASGNRAAQLEFTIRVETTLTRT